jgi:hypothetical protein
MECVSLRGGAEIHYHGKILAKSFLPGMGCVSERWETICEKVPYPARDGWDLPPQETFFSYKIISSKKFSKNA